jgi:alpha-galactosidase
MVDANKVDVVVNDANPMEVAELGGIGPLKRITIEGRGFEQSVPLTSLSVHVFVAATETEAETKAGEVETGKPQVFISGAMRVRGGGATICVGRVELLAADLMWYTAPATGTEASTKWGAGTGAEGGPVLAAASASMSVLESEVLLQGVWGDIKHTHTHALTDKASEIITVTAVGRLRSLDVAFLVAWLDFAVNMSSREGGVYMLIFVPLVFLFLYVASTVSYTFDANALLGKQVVAARYSSVLDWLGLWRAPVYHRQLFDTSNVMVTAYMVVLAVVATAVNLLYRILSLLGIVSDVIIAHDGHAAGMVADRTVLLVNSWNAWGFCGALQPGQRLPVYSMPHMYVRGFHGGGASLRENLSSRACGSGHVASEMFAALVRSRPVDWVLPTTTGGSVCVSSEDAQALVGGFLSQRQQFGCVVVNADRNHISVVLQCDGATLTAACECTTDTFALMGQASVADEPLSAYLDLSARVTGADVRVREAGMATPRDLHTAATAGTGSNGAAPPFPFAVPTGWCSWYHFFEHITTANLAANLARMTGMCIDLDLVDSGFKLFQVDDGYQKSWGDWLTLDATKFPGEGHAPMKDLVGEVVRAGFLPGLWLAPFACDKHSSLQQQHPEWILRDMPCGGDFEDKACTSAPALNSANCGKWFYGLDVTNPEVIAHVNTVLHTVIHAWGFRYLKLDFLYACALEGCTASFHDGSCSPAQAIQRGMAAVEGHIWSLRDTGSSSSSSSSNGVGGVVPGGGERSSNSNGDAAALAPPSSVRPVMVLGCGAPLGAVLGKVHANRVSCDAGLTWYASFPLPYWDQWNLPSARTMLRSTLCRMSMHGRWWINDPDCMIIRKGDDVGFSDDEIWGLAVTKAFSGGSFILSDDLDKVCGGDGMDARKRLLQQMLPTTGQAAVVVDLMHRDMPELMRLEGRVGDECAYLTSTLALANWGEYGKTHVLSAAKVFGKAAVEAYVIQHHAQLGPAAHALQGTLHMIDLRSESHTSQPMELYFQRTAEPHVGARVYDTGFTCAPVPRHSALVQFARWVPAECNNVVYLGSNLHYTGAHELLSQETVPGGRGKAQLTRLVFRPACVRAEAWDGVCWVFVPGTGRLCCSGSAVPPTNAETDQSQNTGQASLVVPVLGGQVWKLPVVAVTAGEECYIDIRQ